MVDIVNEQKKRIRYMYTWMFRRYKKNVVADSVYSAVRSDSVTTDYLKVCQANRMDKSIRFGWLGEAGSKIESGRVSKLYSLDFNNYQNNATQATSTSRPYLCGNIAPNEKLGIKNPNGGGNYMTHLTISFAANESWSVTTVLNWNGDNKDYICYAGDVINSYSLFVRHLTNRFGFYSTYGAAFYGFGDSNPIIGKNIVLSFIAENGILKTYLNNTLINNLTTNTSFRFNSIIRGFNQSNRDSGIVIKSHIIRSQALTPTQVTAEYTYLRSVYPEIESVEIGTQTWSSSNCEMAATPMGNVIAEIQAAGNVEKIVNIADREFSNDTLWWGKAANTVISNGYCRIESNGVDRGKLSSKSGLATVGKYYKLQYEVLYTNNVSLWSEDYGGFLPTSIGLKTVFYKAINSQLTLQNINTALGSCIDIDNISIQEIGWSGSQELYDGIYAQTAGTVEQKTYAAVKAAGFWRNCQTTVDSGALYGKEYNKFAALLLKIDIDYYNLANPTTLWGYRVPLRADLTTLAAYGGNALKLSGNTYWNTANGTNATGFSALGSGIVNADGTNSALKANTYLLCSDANFAREIKDADDTCNEVAITTQGGVMRLIKV